jgi:hypothetical protein
MSPSPYSAASPDKLDEIMRLAELRLAAQLTLGVAADQRAMTMAAILAAVDAALLSAWAALETGASWTLPILILGFAVAAALTAWSALPRAWEVAGNEPRKWLSDIPSGDSLHNGKAAMVGHYDDMLADNERQLTASANGVRAAFVVVILALLVGSLLTFVGL